MKEFEAEEIRQQLIRQLLGGGEVTPEQALNRLERAVNVEDPAPLYHDREIERLRVNWPELSFAVAELLKAHGRRYPPSWDPTELRWSAARYLQDWLRRDSK